MFLPWRTWTRESRIERFLPTRSAGLATAQAQNQFPGKVSGLATAQLGSSQVTVCRQATGGGARRPKLIFFRLGMEAPKRQPKARPGSLTKARLPLPRQIASTHFYPSSTSITQQQQQLDLRAQFSGQT